MNRPPAANRPSAANPVPAPAAAAMAAAYLRYVEGIWEGRPETAAFGQRRPLESTAMQRPSNSSSPS